MRIYVQLNGMNEPATFNAAEAKEVRAGLCCLMATEM